MYWDPRVILLSVILVYELWTEESEKNSTIFLTLYGGLEHLKIETSLIDERFPSVMGECSRLYLELYVKFSTVVYYESIKRELKIRLTYDCRCDERLKTKTEDSTLLGYTGLLG